MSGDMLSESAKMASEFTQPRPNRIESVWEERCELLAENWRLKARIAQLEKPRDPDAVLQESLLREAQDALAKELISQGLNHGKVWQAFQEYGLSVGRTVSAGAANYANVQIDLASSQEKVRRLEEQVEGLKEEVDHLKAESPYYTGKPYEQA